MTAHTSLTTVQLDKVRDLLYKETGVLIETKRDYVLKDRIERRMAAVKMPTFSEYYRSLMTGWDGEIQELMEALTINETYFFRDFPQLQGFAEGVLPGYLDAKRERRDTSLRVWSAACSTGEEAYTLSVILQEMVKGYEKWQVNIEGTDIDRQVLRIARAGEYGRRSMKDTPLPYREKYFEQANGHWRVLPHTAEPVSFDLLNLMDRRSMRRRRGFDFIFCRNVLIYFNDESRKKVVNCLYDALVPGGYVFLGSSESVGRITAAFELEKRGDFLCYKKPLG